MTLNTSLIIDGNAQGAKSALDQAIASLNATNARTNALKTSFDAASGGATNMNGRLLALKSPLDAAAGSTRAMETALSGAVARAAALGPASAATARSLLGTTNSASSAAAALRAARIEMDRMATAAVAVSPPLVAAAPAVNRFSGAFNNFRSLSNSSTFVLQNTAAQLGDIVIQAEAGTPIFRTLGQQLPQLFGGFAFLGGSLSTIAPILSVVAAVSLPIAGLFLAMGDGADAAGDKVKTFADELKEAESAIDAANTALVLASVGGLEDARKKYGELTAAVRELIDVEAERARLLAIREVEDILAPAFGAGLDKIIAERFGDAGRRIVEATATEISVLERSIEGLESRQRQLEGRGLGRSPLVDAQIAEQRELLALLTRDIENAGAQLDGLSLPPELLQDIVTVQDRVKAAFAAGNFSAAADLLADLRGKLVALGLAVDNEVVSAFIDAEGRLRRLNDTAVEGGVVARAEAKKATEERDRQREATEKLIESMRLEVDLLIAGTPELQDQVRLRRALAGATEDQALQLRALAAIERGERENQETGDTLEGLRRRVAELQATPLENARNRALEGLGDNASDADRAEAIRLAEEVFRLEESRRRARGRGARAADTEAEAVDRVFARLQAERDLLLELDPVQREMIRLRGQLTGATGDQIAQIEAEIAGNLRLEETLNIQRDLYDDLRLTASAAFDDLIFRGEALDDVLGNIARSLINAAAQATLFGEGPLAGILGTSGGGGIFGDLLGGLFPGKADGGRISGPGGPRDDRVPILASNGEFVVNAAATARNLPVLEAINAGRAPRFADGGRVGGPVFLPPAGAGGAAGRLEIGVTLKSDLLDARIDSRAGDIAARISTDVAGRVSRAQIEDFSLRELPARVREDDFGKVFG